jgi:hypothetical protein
MSAIMHLKPSSFGSDTELSGITCQVTHHFPEDLNSSATRLWYPEILYTSFASMVCKGAHKIIFTTFCTSQVCLTNLIQLLTCWFWTNRRLQRWKNVDGVSQYIQGDSGGICNTLWNDSMCDSKQKSSYKHVSDFGWLQSYRHFLIPIHALVW